MEGTRVDTDGAVNPGPADNAAETERREGERLGILVGTWHTTGRTTSEGGRPALAIDGTDTYEWAPGNRGLLHIVDALVGSERVEGAELIGYDPQRGAYVTQYFGTDGPNSYIASFDEVDGQLVWRMSSARDRFTGVFDASRSAITGHWEALDDAGAWRPWMEITLTRT